jgi:uncharacterized membrane protein
MEEIIKTSTLYLAQIIELSAAVIIFYASGKAVFAYFKDNVSKSAGYLPDIKIRLNLGKSLAIGLELLLGADILKTAIAPSWDEIGKLAAIAALRTALNYFLERDLKNYENKD